MTSTLLSVLVGLLITPVVSSPAAQTKGMHEMTMAECPMMAGVQVTAKDTKDGITLSFTTKTDIPALQARVENMATMHAGALDAASHIHGDMPRGDMPAGDMHMMNAMMVPAQVKYEKLDNGATLTFVPEKAEQLAELRASIRQHADHMSQEGCSMMNGMMKDMMQSHEGMHK